MQYSEGKIGRIFVLRMDHGDDLIASLEGFVLDKEIDSCMVLFMGALRDGRAVAGPETPVVPPVPHFENFDGAWEVFGMATIYQSADGPKMHVHSAMGRRREAILGCIRESVKIYLVVEAVLYEFTGLKAERSWNEKAGISMLSLEKRL